MGLLLDDRRGECHGPPRDDAGGRYHALNRGNGHFVLIDESAYCPRAIVFTSGVIQPPSDLSF
jgi:hypothetical protein